MTDHPDDALSPPSQSALNAPPLPDAAPYQPRTRRWALIFVVVASFILAAWVASPLWFAILLGLMMAVSAHGPYEKLVAWLGDRRKTWAAALLTLASGLAVAILGLLVFVVGASELSTLVSNFGERGTSGGSMSSIIGSRADAAIAHLGIDTNRLYGWAQREIGAAASYVATMAAIVVRETSLALLSLVVSLTTMYYMLMEGGNLALRIERIAPLEPRHTRALLVEAREVGRTAFLGTIITALVQGAIGGVGYFVLGVPHPVTFAFATFIFSFLPVAGTLLVWVPLSCWFLFEGETLRAILLLVYGVVFITSLADYVIRPRIIGGGSHGHPLLTLIALLGGIEVFGLGGLIGAPIVMSVFVAAFRLYEREARTGSFAAEAPPGEGPGVPSITRWP